MLEWFQNFFLSLGEAIASVFTLIVSLIKSLLDFITLLPTVVTMLVSSIGFLPSVLALFATLSITVSVIYLVVGRNSQ